VLVVGDYIGSSTIAEIAYARSLGKPVRFTHPDVDPAPEEAHVVADSSDDPEHVDDCAGCDPAA
jgi:hypothetical protein